LRFAAYVLPCMLYAACLGLFVALKIALVWHYRHDFLGKLSGYDCAAALAYGLKFDFASVSTFLGLPLLALCLPIPAVAGSRLWRRLWTAVALVMTTALVFLLIADFLYFGYAKRHLADELVIMPAADILSIMSEGFYLGMVLAVIAAGILLTALLTARVAARPLLAQSWAITVFAGCAVFIFLSARGLGSKPLNIADAFAMNSNVAFANIALNGVFSASHAGLEGEAINHRHFSEAELTAVMGALQRQPQAPQSATVATPRPNIVIILLESWSAYYVDSFANRGFGKTPHFDGLAREGLLFENFYASGSRSIEALQAVLTGVPPARGAPVLGKGLEILNVPKLGELGKAAHYRTALVQSSPRGSMRLDALAKALGFDEYYGQEDMPARLAYEDVQGSKFGWDYEAFQQLGDVLDKSPGPTLAVLFTGTTHLPFAKPPAPCAREPHDAEGESGFLNTLCYADWSLGEFFSRARQAPWFDNTVFILTADHTLGAFHDFPLLAQFHIPLVIYGKPLAGQHGRRPRYGSQVDILPTVVGLMGLAKQDHAIGNSLLAASADYAFISSRFHAPTLVTRDGYLRHNLHTVVEKQCLAASCSDDVWQNMQRFLLALDQKANDLLRSKQ